MSIEMIVPLEVGIACRDLPALRRFYEITMGFSFVSEITVPADKSAASGLSADGYTVVRLQTPYGERIKLLAPRTPPRAETPSAYILDRPNAAYLTFIVADIDAAIATLRAAGIEFMTGAQRVEARPGVYLAFCRDPEGNVLELVQYSDIAAYRPDLKKEGQ
ncbi:VOC family protein [Herbaspirillum sp. BH-1]|uniref:Catechol 2,3-dioxygenase-like lactoylglutathione lyase family enzyme n=1 Tax=Herbaspirillum frisingense TaxID=92645 RepID=A0ABU1PA46_9BURK|nr:MULTISPECIES: VOC family protein [Herbaspirillum]MDR6582802.1 catechol 2,3-dioxygenase-like lactoylglutathione lyase family enzyme [Herbaspirillum frisingense]PLY60615.1 VOC family protein [Herbaspirillum sp. BH-1]